MLFWVTTGTVFSQTLSGYIPPSGIIYYTDFLTYINPAGAELKNKYLFNTKVAGYTGIRKSISEYYADGWISFTATRKVSFGLQLYSNNQGPYIHLINSKFISRYSLLLSETSRINTAVGIGFLNYAFEGNEYFGGGSDIVPDADAGISFQNQKWNIGISSLQLINRTLTPISGEFGKRNTYNIHASGKFSRHPSFVFTPFMRLYYDIGTQKINSNVVAEFLFNKYYKIIALLHEQKNAGAGLALSDLPTPVGNLGLNFLFTYPVIHNNGVGSGRYELGLGYRLK